MLDDALKQRLVGGLVLVSLAIIFVPMLVSERPLTDEILPPPAPTPLSDIDGDEFLGTVTETVIAEEPAIEYREEVGTVSDVGPEVAVGEPVDDPHSETSAPIPVAGDAETERDNDRGDVESTKASAWIVQIASFTSLDNAQSLVSTLKERSYPAFIADGEVGGKPYYRVRVGPEILRASAEKVAQEIATETGLQPLVVPHR